MKNEINFLVIVIFIRNSTEGDIDEDVKRQLKIPTLHTFSESKVAI